MKELISVLEDTDIGIGLLGWSWDKIIKIPPSSHLRCDRFKQNFKSYNCIHSMLEVLSDNIEGTISSSLINLCHYISECYKDEFILAAGDSGLTFSSQMSDIETTSMMNDVGINTLQLIILLRILRDKIGAELFERETKMTDLCSEIIVQ